MYYGHIRKSTCHVTTRLPCARRPQYSKPSFRRAHATNKVTIGVENFIKHTATIGIPRLPRIVRVSLIVNTDIILRHFPNMAMGDLDLHQQRGCIISFILNE